MAVLTFAGGAAVTRFLARNSTRRRRLSVLFDLTYRLDFDSDWLGTVPEPSPDGRFLVYMSQLAGEKPVLRIRALGDEQFDACNLDGERSNALLVCRWQMDLIRRRWQDQEDCARRWPGSDDCDANRGFQQPTWGSRG